MKDSLILIFFLLHSCSSRKENLSFSYVTASIIPFFMLLHKWVLCAPSSTVKMFFSCHCWNILHIYHRFPFSLNLFWSLEHYCTVSMLSNFPFFILPRAIFYLVWFNQWSLTFCGPWADSQVQHCLKSWWTLRFHEALVDTAVLI